MNSAGKAVISGTGIVSPVGHDTESHALGMLAGWSPCEALGAVVLTGVRLGATPTEARSAIAGITVVNDVTLRDVLRADLQAGRGIYHAKPLSSMAPVIVTPDELGAAWDGDHVRARMHTLINGRMLGHPATGVDTAVTIPAELAR